MRAFVTGGSGVVGRALVRHLLEEGDDVTALARSEGAAGVLAGLGARVAPGDILDYPSCLAASTGAEVVYHVAGLNEMCPEHRRALHRVNVDGTRTVARAAAAAGVAKLVYTSSAAAHEEPLTAYGLSKRRGEEVAAAEFGISGMVSVAPVSVQGPGRDTGTGRLALALLRGELGVVPDTVFSIVDIGDCARAHRLAARSGEGGAPYLISGATVSTRDLGELRRSLGLPARRIRVAPAWVFGTLWPLVALRPSVGGQRLCPDLLRSLTARHEVDGAPAAAALGLDYTPLVDTLRHLLEWAASAES